MSLAHVKVFLHKSYTETQKTFQKKESLQKTGEISLIVNGYSNSQNSSLL